jgi:MFS family permease
LMRHSHFPSWHFVAGRRNMRLVRDGEVPFIR